ncbi:hypothetical protein [Labilibaculum euxinus]|uniref:Uncharacterized protein n=1 Tax=Labilibaculum euxinus TaxID=2686357 RepID=A0A7M4DBJ6_9BACT|nr:hypothetical protein [Labilibaculum euxinus]MUP40025.1 hypothetical protein [Labilibaculum euxinus]MVB09230.1 hypothetical protein [Labilibaculum euxinus]
MKPEILQTVYQLVLAGGIIFTALGGYGYFHYSKMIEKNREVTVDTKLDNIPQSINTNNNENTDKVLDAIEDVKLSIDEIAATDGSNIKALSYPPSGEFGTNILDKNSEQYSIGTHSMRAKIPKGQSVIVKVSGKNWSFPVFQSIPGWRHFDNQPDADNPSRKFKSVKAGIIDLEMYLDNKGKIEISVFENGSELPSWEKKLIVK